MCLHLSSPLYQRNQPSNTITGSSPVTANNDTTHDLAVEQGEGCRQEPLFQGRSLGRRSFRHEIEPCTKHIGSKRGEG